MSQVRYNWSSKEQAQTNDNNTWTGLFKGQIPQGQK